LIIRARVLKSGGRLALADIVTEVQLPDGIVCDSTHVPADRRDRPVCTIDLHFGYLMSARADALVETLGADDYGRVKGRQATLAGVDWRGLKRAIFAARAPTIRSA
jgi:hypothetical protein